jgi:hypothetical protein
MSELDLDLELSDLETFVPSVLSVQSNIVPLDLDLGSFVGDSKKWFISVNINSELWNFKNCMIMFIILISIMFFLTKNL